MTDDYRELEARLRNDAIYFQSAKEKEAADLCIECADSIRSLRERSERAEADRDALMREVVKLNDELNNPLGVYDDPLH